MKKKPKLKKSNRVILYGLFLIIALIVPQLVNDYKVMVIDLGMLMAISVLGLIVLVNFTGQISLGQVAYYAIGSYTAGYCITQLNINPWIAVLLGSMCAMLLGVMLGVPAFNLKGPFLAIITIGFYEIVNIILVNWIDVTGGPYGMSSISPLKIGNMNFSKPVPFYYMTIVIILIIVLAIIRIRKSRVGRAMISVMNDEVASDMLGVNVRQIKLVSFGISAFLAGLGGSLFAVFVGYIVPEAFSSGQSSLMLSMSIVSGANVILAPIIAVIINALPEMLRSLQEYYLLIFSLILLVFIMFSAWRQYKNNNDF